MAEPHTSVAIGAAQSTAFIMITGTVFGADLDATLVGLFAAIFMSFQLDRVNSWAKAAASVALAGMVSGYGSRVAAAWLSWQDYGLQQDDPTRLLLALLIGIAIPAFLPSLIHRGTRIIEGEKP